jgi:polyisoprenoid-binding protein YceI
MSSYTVDTSHSEVGFTVRHMMFAKVRGQFKTWAATAAYDAADPTKSVFHAEIDTASIDTHEAKRDEHLRSGDFFDAAKFPKITFDSKRIERAGAGAYKLTGDLTIHGATHPITLDVEENGGGEDPWGNERKGFTAKGSLSRTAFGLTWNQALEAGGVLVSDKVDVDIEIQVIAGK